MKKITLNSIRWMTIHLSVFMMTFAPVVDGFAAQKAAKDLNEAQVKALLMDLGMTKSQTLGSFYAKNKSQFPARIQNLVADLFAKHKNKKMPMFEVATAKSADGKTVPVVRAQIEGMLFNVEVHNNDKYFAKIGHTELTNIDINNFSDMFEKLYHNDYNFRRWADAQKAKTTRTSTVITGAHVKNEFSLPEIDKEIWKKLTPEGRVQYILNMRQLWTKAMTVLMYEQKTNPGKKSGGKKTSSFELMEEIWKLMNADAEAVEQPAAVGVERRNTGTVPGVKGKIQDGCLIAGYAVVYKGKGTTVCDVQDVKKRYNTEVFTKAHAECGTGEIACNPMIYGTPGGKARCVAVSSDSGSRFQIATHYNGPCEENNHLASEIKFLKEDLKDKNRYSKDNLVAELDTQDKINDKIKLEQQEANYKQTKDFLDGVMKSRHPELVEMFQKGEINDKVIEALQGIREGFETQIKEARDTCKASASSGRKQEKNFWYACDQMQRREIFIADYIRTQIGCKDDGSKFDKNTYKCICPAQFGQNIFVQTNQSCGGTLVGTPGECKKRNPDNTCADSTGGGQCLANGTTADGKPCATPAEVCKNAGMVIGPVSASMRTADINCLCLDKNGKPMANVRASIELVRSGEFTKDMCPGAGGTAGTGGAGGGAVAPVADEGESCPQKRPDSCDSKTHDWERIVNRDGTVGCDCKAKKDDDKGSWWKDNKENVYMAAVLGGFVFLMHKTAPKKPSLIPPGDLCTGGESACPGVCPKANQVKVNGVCQCREPSPLEVVTDAVECTFGPKSNSGTTTLTCPDNATILYWKDDKPPSINDCPKQTCSDGSTVYMGQSCPTENPATKPTPPSGEDVKR